VVKHGVCDVFRAAHASRIDLRAVQHYDLYRDVDDIRATGRAIVYCLNQTVGHLAIFVSSKVGAKEDEEMVRLMDMIDCLPPGLYELIISPRPADAPPSELRYWQLGQPFRSKNTRRHLCFRPQPRGGRRAFAAAARMSELTHSIYRTFWQPIVRWPTSRLGISPAGWTRLSYTMFADSNTMMKGVASLAEQVTANRKPASPDNLFLELQKQVSDQIIAVLDAFRDARDRMAEQMFFGIYGSPVVQGRPMM
jgi:hypothetical protein